MDEAASFLKEWFIRFLENRDSARKNIVSIGSKEGFDFAVNYKDKSVNFLIAPILDGSSLEKVNNNGNFGLIALNNSQNIKFLYEHWKKIAEIRLLSMYFVNPFSNTDKAWIVCPCVHDGICDKNSLWLGLKAMAEMVEPINYERLGERLKLERQATGLQNR